MTTPLIVIDVTGYPVPAARARTFMQAGRAVTTTPPIYRKWKDDARMVARQAMNGRAPLAGCLRLHLEVCFPPPEKSWATWKVEAALRDEIKPSGRPDLDNLLKAAKDALNGIVWLDDAQVVEVEAVKRYSAFPRVTAKVQPMRIAPASIRRRSDLEAYLR